MLQEQDAVKTILITARRNQILDAATTVFAQKGFHRATIKDIARQAGIADGTIYTYFTNKNDVLLAILNRLNESEQRDEQLRELDIQDFRTYFIAYSRKRLELLWNSAETLRVVLPELLTNSELRTLYYEQIIAPTTQLGETYFQHLVDQGKLKPIDVPLTVRTLSASVLGILLLHLLGDETLTQRWEDVPEIMATIILDGISNTS